MKINVEIKHGLHYKQLELHDLCLNDKYFFVTCLASRQSGKSYYVEYLIPFLCLSQSDQVVWYVTPSEAQSKRMYRAILSKYAKTKLIKQHYSTAGDIRIEWVNGSLSEFKSSKSEDTLRGNSVNTLLMDECAFIKRSTINEILLPTLNARGKRCILLSTARGRNNVFYEFYQNGLKQNIHPRFASFQFSYRDNPKSNLELIETIKKNVPEKVWLQEYGNEWVDRSQVFNDVHELMVGTQWTEPKPGINLYAGCDIGMKEDATCLTIIDDSGNVIFIDSFRGDAPLVKLRIKHILDKFKPKKVYIETTGIGLPIYDDLKAIPVYHTMLEPFYTSNESKAEMISSLINAVEEKKITLPKDAHDLADEMEDFGFSFTSTGRLSYASIGGSDDLVMSLGLAYSCYLKHKKKGKMTVLFG